MKNIYKHLDCLCIAALGFMSFFLLYKNGYTAPYGGDVGDGSYAMLAAIAKNLERGELPLWNPYLWGGVTQVGISTSQAFYPITYLLCILCYKEEVGFLSYSSVVYFSFLIHLFILAAGMYFLLRTLKFNCLTAFSMASMAIFSGSGIRMSGWQNIFSSIAYVPVFLSLVILMLESEEKKRLLYSVLAGGVLGLSGLASVSHGVLILIATFVIVYLVYMWSFRWDKKKMLYGTGCCFLTSGIGMGIMSISLLPFVQFLSTCYRFIGQAGDSSIEGGEKPSFASFIANSAEMPDMRKLVGSYIGWFAIGTVLIILAFIGLFCKSKQNKSAYWLGVNLMFAGLLYSCSLFVTNIAFYVPFFNQIRESFLYCSLFAIGAAIVGAFGLNAILSMKPGEKFSEKCYNPTGLFICIGVLLFSALFPNKKFAWNIFALVCGTILLVISGKIFSSIVYKRILLMILVGMEFFTFRSVLDNRGGYTAKEASESVYQTNIDALRLLDENDLPSNDDAWRIMQWNSALYKAYPANIWGVWGYNDALGNMNPLPANVMNVHSWGLDNRMALSNIRYLVCTSQEELSFLSGFENLGLKEVRRVNNIKPDYAAKETVEDIVYENVNRKGNAWLVENWIGYSDKDDVDELNSMINSTDFQPFSTALINTDTCKIQLKEKYGSSGDSEIQMLEYNANSVKFQVDAVDEVLMITSEMMAPGWEVYIDGKKSDILEVNTAYRGCVVPQGEHIVKYRYLPKTFVIGCMLASVSMLTILA